VRALASGIIGLVGSPIGIVLLAALDSTVFFSLPGGIDAAVVLLTVRRHVTWWLVILLATAGSVGGAALTFWMGVKIGEHRLDRYISPKRLARIRRKVRTAGAVRLAVLDLIPPPFPFTPFILAAGALDADAATFFGTLTACRLLRFGAEALLAVFYGPRLLAWLDSDTLHNILLGGSVLGVALTTASITKFLRSSRLSRRPAPA
jgi:membrane protein YqaA with SNARE-associated domain